VLPVEFIPVNGDVCVVDKPGSSFSVLEHISVVVTLLSYVAGLLCQHRKLIRAQMYHH
jgi:hypothetical protein